MIIELGQSIAANPENSINYGTFGVVDSLNAEYLRGVGQRFYTEFDFNTGLEILNELLAHPMVQPETLKLFQEVAGLDYKLSYSRSQSSAKEAEIIAHLATALRRVDIKRYLQSCLTAYVTGVVCSELVWAGTKKKPELAAIKYINPKLYRISSSGIDFRKSFNTGEVKLFNPYKFLRYTYSTTLETSFIGNGVGKVLYYLLKDRAELQCMTKRYALKGVTPTLLVKAEAGVSAKVVQNISRALNAAEDWKTIPIPKGVTVEALETKQDFQLYQYLLEENESLIVKLVSGEDIVGNQGSSAGSSRTAAEASNLRRSRANALIKSVVKHINEAVITVIVNAKFGPQDRYPEMSFGLPSSSGIGIATIPEAIALAQAFGYKINPEFFEKMYSIDLVPTAQDLAAAPTVEDLATTT